MQRFLVRLFGTAEILIGLTGMGLTAWLFIEARQGGEPLGMGWLAVPPLVAVWAALPLGFFLLRGKHWAWSANLILIPVLYKRNVVPRGEVSRSAGGGKVEL